MAQDLTLVTQAQTTRAALPAHLQERLRAIGVAKELGEGITAGFATVSLRGKAWRIKHRGEERLLLNADGRTPRYMLNVVLVKAAAGISKVWYETGYVEGSNAPPDCWSVDGRVPDRASPKLQNPTCAGCRWNAWGSSRTQGGSGKGKDCADSKRLAIVPAADVENEVNGGPMLLRIPPASLGELGKYYQELASMGLNYFEVETEMSFDPNAEYPRVLFRAVGILDSDRLATVMDMYSSSSLDRMLATPIEEVRTDGVDTSHATPPVPGQQAVQQPPAAFKPVLVQQEPLPYPLPQKPPHERRPEPEPVADPVVAPVPQVDARLQGLIQAGLSGQALIDTARMLGIAMPGAPEPVKATPTPAPAPKPVEPEPAPAPLPAAPPPKENAFAPPAQAEAAPKPRKKAPEPVPVPTPAEAAQAPSEAGNATDDGGPIPAGFDDMLSNLLTGG